MNIVITGASTGIGAETARVLAAGNELFLHYNASSDAARKVASEVESAGGAAHTCQADLRSEAGCQALYDQIAPNTDHVDVLINNAGGLVQRQPCGEFEWSLMEEIFALNTFQAMKVTSLCLPLLQKAEAPVVIFISSVAARSGAPGATIYGACKGALDALTRGLAAELAPKIRVNAVAPGVIETPFHEKVSTPEKMREFREKSALRRNGNAGHIASAIKLLVENDFLTGETIDVNGGMFMR